jgi:hypothetical protein
MNQLSKQSPQIRNYDIYMKYLAQNAVMPGAQRNHTTRDALGMQDNIELYGSVDIDYRSSANSTYGFGTVGE